MQNTDYKNMTDDELFVIIDEKNFLQSTHLENMKQLVKIDGEFKERFLKIRNSIINSTKPLIENIIANQPVSDESDSFKVAYQNLKSRGIL